MRMGTTAGSSEGECPADEIQLLRSKNTCFVEIKSMDIWTGYGFQTVLKIEYLRIKQIKPVLPSYPAGDRVPSLPVRDAGV